MRLLALLTAVVVSSAGCSEAAGGGTTAPDGYALDMVTHSGGYWDDADVIAAAEERLVRECMRARGFTTPAPAAAEPAPRHGEVAGVDLGYRRAHGYGLTDDAVAARSPRPQPPAPPPGYDHALRGDTSVTVGKVVVASGGCMGQARAAVAGSVERWATAVYAPDFLNDDLIAATAADPARDRAEREWQACMAGQGYRFTGYDQPRAEAARHPAAERRIATADGVCLVRARVIETGIELRRRAALAMPPQWRAELVRAAEIRRAAAAGIRREAAAGIRRAAAAGAPTIPGGA
ncbi:hypothetical protein ACQP2F_21190 [Actinoplanes sp. CA-030573]|uniref:hypothetical protein n=1 Tax=Actinoplanes sp. CA-030573 TaxID=3239898 RepID=UPI003D8B32B3